MCVSTDYEGYEVEEAGLEYNFLFDDSLIVQTEKVKDLLTEKPIGCHKISVSGLSDRQIQVEFNHSGFLAELIHIIVELFHPTPMGNPGSPRKDYPQKN